MPPTARLKNRGSEWQPTFAETAVKKPRKSASPSFSRKNSSTDTTSAESRFTVRISLGDCGVTKPRAQKKKYQRPQATKFRKEDVDQKLARWTKWQIRWQQCGDCKTHASEEISGTDRARRREKERGRSTSTSCGPTLTAKPGSNFHTRVISGRRSSGYALQLFALFSSDNIICPTRKSFVHS